jgi:hypothetical protein
MRAEDSPAEARATEEGAPFEFRPARFGPMTVALLFILGVSTPFAAGERLVAGRVDQAALALLPLALVGLFGYLSSPSPLRIGAAGIEVSRSRAARIGGAALLYRWPEVTNIFPTFYEDAGIKFSPFAAAEGTARHAGLRIETAGGEKLVIPFTPTVLDLRHHGTAPYHAAVEAVEKACRDAGRPLVRAPPGLTAEEAEEMLTEAAKPLLPFPVTVAGIFAPALLIPGLAALASTAAGPLAPGATALIVMAGLSPLAAVFLVVNLRSGKRTELLHEVQKQRQSDRERQPKAGAPAPSPEEVANRPAPPPPGRVLTRRAR